MFKPRGNRPVFLPWRLAVLPAAVVLPSAAVAALLFGTGIQSATGQHRIVLRDLTLLDSIQIAGMNPDGVSRPDGPPIPWSDILRGEVGPFQEEFDRYVATVGDPLFRIRHRLSRRLHEELQPLTDRLLANVADSTGPAMYVACAARFHHRLQAGQREAAAVPLVHLLQLRTLDSRLQTMDDSLGLAFLESGLAASLLPVWFDEEAARRAVEELRQPGPFSFSFSAVDGTETPERTAMAVYEQSLRLHGLRGHGSGDPAASVSLNNKTWSPVLSAQSALINGNDRQVIEILPDRDPFHSAERQAIALYYRGVALRTLAGEGHDMATAEPWVLQLLQIPASYQHVFPELSAAAIFEVVSDPEQDSATRESLGRELTGRFSNTWHGRQFSRGKPDK